VQKLEQKLLGMINFIFLKIFFVELTLNLVSNVLEVYFSKPGLIKLDSEGNEQWNKSYS